MKTTHPSLPSDFEPKLARGHINRTLYADTLQVMKERKVIILQAPPGFGKHSLLAHLFRKTSGVKIWLTMTAKDNDSSIFIAKLTQGLALSKIHLSAYEAMNLQRSSADDIADIIHFVVTRPYHVNIEDLVVYPTAQASATVVHKNL